MRGKVNVKAAVAQELYHSIPHVLISIVNQPSRSVVVEIP